MFSDQTIASIRFGYGLGPPGRFKGLSSPTALLGGPDRSLSHHPGISTDDALALARELGAAAKARRMDEAGAKAAVRKINVRLRSAYRLTLTSGLARILDTDDALRERLTWFWVDHFTATAKNARLRGLTGAYIDDAIRPHITGRFGDLLKAAVTHPFMLHYLDQPSSVGPNSKIGKRRNRGLNENLAREVLELHTLGVSGDYSQADVRKLAELMTGLSIHPEKGFVFRAGHAEPGPEAVLGKSYGGGKARLDDVLAVLDDMSVHPDTVRHIARKLAVHFISPDPDPALIGDLEQIYRATDGDLSAVYDVLVAHPAAQVPIGAKAKQPFEYIASALVALGVGGDEVMGLSDKDVKQGINTPLIAMGQPFLDPPGPDGWSERAQDWITPQGLASRITWAMAIARKFQGRIKDPRTFLEDTLGDLSDNTLIFAVSAAQTRAEGIGLVLASAQFNRR